MEVQEATSVGSFLAELDPTFHSKMSGVSLFGRGWLSSKYSLVIDVLYQHRQKKGIECSRRRYCK